MLFQTVNTELVKVNHWFITNYTLFHRPSTKDDIPVKTPEVVISNKLIEQKRLIKVLGVNLDESIS